MDMFLSTKTSTWKSFPFERSKDIDNLLLNTEERVSFLSDNELSVHWKDTESCSASLDNSNISCNSEELFLSKEKKTSRSLQVYSHCKRVTRDLSRSAKYKFIKVSKDIKAKVSKNCFTSCLESNQGLHKHYSYSILDNSDMKGCHLLSQFSSTFSALRSKATSDICSDSHKSYHGETRVTSSQFVTNDILELHGAKSRRSVHNKMYQVYKGQIKLTAQVTDKTLTISIIQGKDLPVVTDKGCSSFVKVSINGRQASHKNIQQTKLTSSTQNPVFEESFSFKLKKKHFSQRLQVSVYHYNPVVDYSKVIGCMSFCVKSIADSCNGINGWYYILADNLGEFKHMKVFEKSKCMKYNTSHLTGKKVTKRIHPSGQAFDYESDTSGYCGSQSEELSDNETGVSVNSNKSRITADMCRIPISKCSQSYGFSLVEGCPAKVSHVQPNSPAQEAGLCLGDYIIQINGQQVFGLKSSEIARIIRHYPWCMVIDVLRADHKEAGPATTLPREKCWWFLNHVECDFNDSMSECGSLED